MNIHESLRQLGNLMTKQINNNLEKYDLTFAQSSVLMFVLLNQDKKINQRQIEIEFSLSNPTVNGILNRLENKKLIKRESDELDKRIKNIIPLSEAFSFFESIKETKEKMEISMLKGISNEELETLLKVIEKMNKNLKENINERNI